MNATCPPPNMSILRGRRGLTGAGTWSLMTAGGCGNAWLWNANKGDIRMIIAPSVLAVWDKSGGDYGAVVMAAKQALAAGADWVHVDVMDGVYVPAMTFGVEMVEKLQGTGVLDVHLMVERPELVVRDYVGAGADRVVFHPSTCDDVGSTLRMIRDLGAVAGLALDVDEDVSWLAPWFEPMEEPLVEQVLVMTVKAGAGGQAFRHDMLEKVRAVRRMVGPDVTIVLDGGVNANVVAECKAAGADAVVAGSAVFGAADMKAAIAGLRG
ncbi:MAG: ribulose-phosphate 3-epimerase [Rubrivivax sp.]|nr:MAG: ribulose-phosphate 3-epimerase [Rubrivivax sp.]